MASTEGQWSHVQYMTVDVSIISKKVVFILSFSRASWKMVPIPHDGVAAVDRVGRVCDKLARYRRSRRPNCPRTRLLWRALCHITSNACKENSTAAALTDEVSNFTGRRANWGTKKIIDSKLKHFSVEKRTPYSKWNAYATDSSFEASKKDVFIFVGSFQIILKSRRRTRMPLEPRQEATVYLSKGIQ